VGTTGVPQGLAKIVTTGNFSKIQKLPQTSPNFLKIVENISSKQLLSIDKNMF
jgi:hypothetical protein